MTRLAFIALCLSAHAHAGEYWTLDHAPVTPLMTVELDAKLLNFACSGGMLDSYGCFDQQTGITYLRAGMNEAIRKCVARHELKHAEGYSHPAQGYSFVDCGDGSWLSDTTIGRM